MAQNDKILELFRKYINEELSEDELQDLKQYLNESPENEGLFVHFLSFYKTNLQMASAKRINKDNAWHQVRQSMHKDYKKFNYKVWFAAASVFVIIGLSTVFYLNMPQQTKNKNQSLAELYPNKALNCAMLTLSNGKIVALQKGNGFTIRNLSGAVLCYVQNGCLMYKNVAEGANQYNKITVPKGSEYSVTLSDGTHIWLNAQSELEYPVAFSSVRNVKLKGEAYFEVKHNDHSPFIVHSGYVQVKVLGTKFNVSAYNSNKILVTLVKGKVAVAAPSGNETLHVGDQVQISNGDIMKRQVDTETYISWVDGTYEFDDVPMEDIMKQLSSWYNVKIVFASPDLSNIRFTGAIFRNSSLGYTFELIQKISNLSFQKDNGEIIVTQKGETR